MIIKLTIYFNFIQIFFSFLYFLLCTFLFLNFLFLRLLFNPSLFQTYSRLLFHFFISYHSSFIYRSSLYSNFLFSEMVQRINRFTKKYDGFFNVPGIAFFIPLTVNDFAVHLVYRALLLSCRTSYQKQLHRVRCCESSQYYRHH